MDLIVQKRGTNSSRQDIAVAYPLEVDIALGVKNDFAVKLSLEEFKGLGEVNFVYYEGTEYGGIVDKVLVDTKYQEVQLYGRCWTGVLNTRIIKPNYGQDYYTVSGTAQSIMEGLVNRLALSDLFEVGACASVSFSFTFDRYVGGYDGITKMLRANGLKLQMIDKGEKVEISAALAVDYSDLDEWSSSQMNFYLSRLAQNSNHYLYMVCLGSGELRDRMVVNMRLDLQTGAIQRAQTYTLDAYSYEMVFDYPNAESEDVLIAKATERLTDIYENTYTIETDFENFNVYDIGDIVGARDEALGLSVTQPITSKVLYIDKNGKQTITCKIGGN